MLATSLKNLVKYVEKFNVKPDSDELNKILQKLYEQAKHYLSIQEDSEVCDIFNFLFEQDSVLKEKIASALMPQGEEYILDEDSITQLIELQSFYSIFRLNLLNDIIENLIGYYDLAINMISADLEKGGKLSFLAKKKVEYYDMRIKKLGQTDNLHRKEMHFQVTEVYKEVHKWGENNLIRLTQEIVNKEQELKDDLIMD